jgi:hypothetical protein
MEVHLAMCGNAITMQTVAFQLLSVHVSSRCLCHALANLLR